MTKNGMNVDGTKIVLISNTDETGTPIAVLGFNPLHPDELTSVDLIQPGESREFDVHSLQEFRTLHPSRYEAVKDGLPEVGPVGRSLEMNAITENADDGEE